MLLIRNFVALSSVEGLGCFADEDIPKGTTIWRLDDDFDVIMPLEAYEDLPYVAKEFMDRYAYQLKDLPGKIILESDNTKFTNHSRTPNIGKGGKPLESVALRDIKKGEELTCDYRKYENEPPETWL